MAEPGRVRFGVFDFDPATQELRRDGSPVRLQSQPAQVLGLLLAQAGEIVSRDALRQAIWGADTFVDFDRGLNFCIAQIRAALGDSADSPRFVKTLPKRGYQFIAPVGPVMLRAPQAEPRTARPFPKWQLTAAIALAIALAGAIFWSTHRATAPRIAVARFDNQTDMPDFDRFTDALTDSVVAELTVAGSSHYAVIGNAAVLRQSRPLRDLVTIASTLKVGYVILGQVQRTSSGVHVLAHLIRVPDQAHVSVARLDSDLTDPLRAQLDLAQRISRSFAPCLPPNPGCGRLTPSRKQ
jgi:DNA-binding winged helix-turn-helix (wHTH) protein/TolB-like protein